MNLYKRSLKIQIMGKGKFLLNFNLNNRILSKTELI
jgi:hypothetical protein